MASFLDALLQLSNQSQFGQQPQQGWGQVAQGLQGLAQLQSQPSMPLEHLSKLAGASRDYIPAYASALTQLADPDRGINNAYKQAQIAAFNDPLDSLIRLQQVDINRQNTELERQKLMQDLQRGQTEQQILGGSPTPALMSLPTSPVSPTSPLNIRNNNPGNIRDPRTGEFRQFGDPETGLAALRSDLIAKVSGNSPAVAARFGKDYTPTLETVFTTYAPPLGERHSILYCQCCKANGLRPQTKIN